MKLCVQCRHYEEGKCYHPNSTTKYIDPVGGEEKFSNAYGSGPMYCSTARLHGWLGTRITQSCGKEGRFWEAKK